MKYVQIEKWCITSLLTIMDIWIRCNMRNEMSGVLGYDFALKGYTGLGTTWANGMSFVMNHAPSAGSIPWPVDQQSTAIITTNNESSAYIFVSYTQPVLYQVLIPPTHTPTHHLQVLVLLQCHCDLDLDQYNVKVLHWYTGPCMALCGRVTSPSQCCSIMQYIYTAL